MTKNTIAARQRISHMPHSEYLEHIDRHFARREGDSEFRKAAKHYEKEIGIMRLLNLDSVMPVLTPLYCPKPKNKPRDPLCMLRALILMTLLRFSGIDDWVAQTRYESIVAILCGFEPDDVPGVGTYYDFQKRIIDGPYRKRRPGKVKKSELNAKPHLRSFQSEKEAKKHEKDPNHSQSEILVRDLLAQSDESREDGFEKIVEDLLFQAGIIPSIEAGLLDNLEKLIVVGDGSIMKTAASADGRPSCSCRKEGVFKCDHPRLYSSPTAQWCHNHRTNGFEFGDRYYHLIVAANGHDFPLLSVMPGGNESDYTLSLKALDRFLKAGRENEVDIKIHAFAGDGHHDSNAHYRYLIENEIIPVIPLSANSKPVSPHLPGRDELRLDDDGTPLCPANARMRRHQFDKKQKKHVYCCPAKRGTHKKGKAVYAFREDLCPRGSDCKPGSWPGPFVYIKSDSDPRLFPPLPRESKLYKEIANQRSAAERINSVLDSYKIENTCRNADYGLIRILLANIAHHASVRYAEAVKKEAAAADLKTKDPESETVSAPPT